MIALFQAAMNHKPVARAIHKFNQSTSAKWVPVNKSFITLSKIILRAAVDRLGLAHAAITLRCVTHQGYHHLLLVNDTQDLQLAAAGKVEEFFISTQEANNSPFEDFIAETAFSLPLNFKLPQGQPQRLGYLVAQAAPGVEAKPAQLTKELALVADEIIRTIGRYQTRYRAIHIYGDQSYWIGNSKALRQLDQRIDQLAKGTQPVLIRANKGSGKVIAARSLHCLSRADTAPFIESDCNEWEEGAAASILQSLHTYANGGTLFVRNIDALSSSSFQALRNFWLKAANARFDGTYSVRLIMSLSSEDAPLASSQSQWLAQHALELRLPALRERYGDLRDLAQFYIREFALTAEFDLTEEAWQLLESTDSLVDVEQLKAAIQKLSLIANGALVSAEELRSVLD
ncbi:sigma 54-interacting transcriptional regulator [Cellvibrio fibrivorans]|uniref:Transcriptional regulator of acetoin/glycerol metabolism n=1 Tax=Cellvibrio fibrivorans TaxID=126350 RepID=A0ABU1UT67_9GAMM|nr:sigma 54-interacting transcriptional regulator [Cellvibrio fibrivorans]MDR7088377.1 transcriptional regulator of acetoin/glycerol metabolism [Cellvibrio fibrivorans]